jgi:hypothetical protein
MGRDHLTARQLDLAQEALPPEAKNSSDEVERHIWRFGHHICFCFTLSVHQLPGSSRQATRNQVVKVHQLPGPSRHAARSQVVQVVKVHQLPGSSRHAARSQGILKGGGVRGPRQWPPAIGTRS